MHSCVCKSVAPLGPGAGFHSLKVPSVKRRRATLWASIVDPWYSSNLETCNYRSKRHKMQHQLLSLGCQQEAFVKAGRAAKPLPSHFLSQGGNKKDWGKSRTRQGLLLRVGRGFANSFRFFLYASAWAAQVPGNPTPLHGGRTIDRGSLLTVVLLRGGSIFGENRIKYRTEP